MNDNLSFHSFYFNAVKLNVITINGKAMFLAKELPKAFNKLDSYSKYVRRFVNSKDITKIKFHGYKDTNLTILWGVCDTAPVMLVNVSGALAMIHGLASDKVNSFREAVSRQIYPAHTVSQSYFNLTRTKNLSTRNTTSIEIHVLKDLIRKLEHQSATNISLNSKSKFDKKRYNKNLSEFISISQIASKDYGQSPYWLNKHLSAFNLQYKKNGVGPYLLCHQDKKYAELVYRSGGHTCLKWHPLGRKLIHEVMYRHGYSYHK